jgi:hypothetical protein
LPVHPRLIARLGRKFCLPNLGRHRTRRGRRLAEATYRAAIARWPAAHWSLISV